MSGLACGVLLPHRLRQEQEQELSALIDLISVSRTPWNSPRNLMGNSKLRASGCEFEVSTLMPVGGAFKGRGWHPCIELELEGLSDDELIAQGWPKDQLPSLPGGAFDAIERAFSIRPRQQIVMRASARDEEDHQVLGELALFLAERYGGVIQDVADCGVNDPPTDLPGQVIAVPWMPGRRPAFYIADARFLRAWLGHPRFHMTCGSTTSLP
jgi:hypothetical protein